MHRICRVAMCHNNYARTDPVYFQSETCSCMYFLRSGLLNYEAHSAQGASVLSFEPGEWLCEASLWTTWQHLGTLYAKFESALMLVDSIAFCREVRNHPDVAALV